MRPDRKNDKSLLSTYSKTVLCSAPLPSSQDAFASPPVSLPSSLEPSYLYSPTPLVKYLFQSKFRYYNLYHFCDAYPFSYSFYLNVSLYLRLQHCLLHPPFPIPLETLEIPRHDPRECSAHSSILQYLHQIICWYPSSIPKSSYYPSCAYMPCPLCVQFSSYFYIQMALQVLGHQWASYKKYLSRLFTFFLGFRSYLLVFNTAVGNVSNNVVIIMLITKITVSLLIALVKKNIFQLFQGKVRSQNLMDRAIYVQKN